MHPGPGYSTRFTLPVPGTQSRPGITKKVSGTKHGAYRGQDPSMLGT